MLSLHEAIESITITQMATRVFSNESPEGILRADVSGAPTSTMDALFGIGSVIVGAVMIITFFVMSGLVRSGRQTGYIDMRPSPGRLLFGQTISHPGREASDRSAQ